MARPRTPTNVLELRGAFKKDPQRRREEPKTVGVLSDAPEYLDDEVRGIWDEFVGCAPIGVMTDSDRLSLEIACHLMREFRQNPVEFTAAKIGRLQALLGSFGMTPADRAKLASPGKSDEENPFANLLKKSEGRS